MTTGAGSGRAPGRVLVLDDEEPVRRTLAAVLERRGYRVSTAKNGCHGLQELLRHEFDLVVLDVRMPGLGGLVFLREMRKVWPALGTVVVSGFLDDAIRGALNALQVHEIHAKPLASTELYAAMEREMARLHARRAALAPVPFRQAQQPLRLLRQFSDAALLEYGPVESMMALSRGMGDMLPCGVVGILLLNPTDAGGALVFHVRDTVAAAALDQLKTEILRQAAVFTGRPPDPAALEVTVFGLGAMPEAGAELESSFMVPLLVEGRCGGLLVMAAAAPAAFSETDVSMVYHAANHLSTTLATLRHMHELAVRDPLTGLYNRRFLHETLDHCWAASLRYRQELSLAVLDVDRFKEVNDKHGHAAGDLVLKELGALLAEECRDADIAGRSGGDELLMVMPQTPLPAAETAVQRLLERIRTHVFRTPRGEPLGLSVSAGLAGSLHACRLAGWDGLVSAADLALYAVKEKGRGGCGVAGSGSPPARRGPSSSRGAASGKPAVPRRRGSEPNGVPSGTGAPALQV